MNSLFGLLAYMAVSNGAGRVFNWFVNMTSVSGLMSWFGICVTYIRFWYGMKRQGIDRKSFPYYSIFQPYAAWYSAIACIVINFVRIAVSYERPVAYIDCVYSNSSQDGPCSSGATGPATPS